MATPISFFIPLHQGYAIHLTALGRRATGAELDALAGIDARVGSIGWLGEHAITLDVQLTEEELQHVKDESSRQHDASHDEIAGAMEKFGLALDSLESAIEEHNRRFTTGAKCDEYSVFTLTDLLYVFGLSRQPF